MTITLSNEEACFLYNALWTFNHSHRHMWHESAQIICDELMWRFKGAYQEMSGVRDV